MLDRSLGALRLAVCPARGCACAATARRWEYTRGDAERCPVKLKLHRHRRLVIPVLVAAVATWVAVEDRLARHSTAAAPQAQRPAQAGAMRGIDVPVSLHGEEAIAYLKQQGTHDSLHAALTRARYAIHRVDGARTSNGEGTYEALNPAGDLRASFTGRGVRVRSSSGQKWQMGLELKAYGYGEDLMSLRSGEMKVRDNRIEISKHAARSPRSPALVEWYVNTPEGLEQGFTLAAPPDGATERPAAGRTLRTAGGGWLRLTLELTGDVQGELSADGQAVLLKDPRGRHVASYDHLEASDATGRALAVRMAVRGHEVSLQVDDRDAQYPIVVDPLVWQQTANLSGGGMAFDQGGSSVAISGNTAIIGSFHDQFNHGAGFDTKGQVFVFVRKSLPWGEEPSWEYQATLEPEAGTHTQKYGTAVAISGDTVIVGDYVGSFDVDSFGIGAAYIFVRAGEVWTMRKRIEPSDRNGGTAFGYAVAISGETAVVGAPFYGPFVRNQRQGRAYVFASNGGSWTEDKIFEPDDGAREDNFGLSVAISGETVIVGAPYHDVATNEDQGQAYVFVRESGNWSGPTKLVGSIGAPFDHFGYSVGVSRNTAIVGAYGPDEPPAVGVAYIFGRNSLGWTEKQILAADDGQAPDRFGLSVAIAGDTAVVGAPDADVNVGPVNNPHQGAAYVFNREGAVWKQKDKLKAGDGASNDAFGYSVSIGGVGLVVGAPGHDLEGKQNQGQTAIFQQLDSDADGLPDEWETKGVTIEGSFIDLPKMGADPRHKDIFVHADWMATGPNGAVLKPSARAIKMVTDAFATSPVTNPDNKMGVHLHVDLGPDSIMNPLTGAKWNALSRAGEVEFQETLGSFGDSPEYLYKWDAFDDVKKTHFSAFHRDTIFHYALFCNILPDVLLLQRTIRGNARSDPGADFLVALGAFKKADGTVGSTPLQQALTFMHELGHNLGLDHGGGDRDNYKPNYLSVMNYRFDSTGLLVANKKQRKLDYSRSALPTLNEKDLNEAVGIRDPAGHLTTWNPLTGKTTQRTTPSGFNQCLTNSNGYWKKFLPGPALDWDCDGMVTPVTSGAPLSEDLNSDGRCIAPGRDEDGAEIPLETTEAFLLGDDEIRAGYVTSGKDRICQTLVHGINDIPLKDLGFAQPDELVGFDDWSALKFDGGGKVGASLGEDDTDPASTPFSESATERFQEEVPAALLAEDEAAPLDEVTYAPQEGPASLTVDFDGTASTAVSGAIVDWAWDFGDGASGTGATVTHTYDTPGEYFATLTVTDNGGRVNLMPQLNLVTVTDAPPPTYTPTRTRTSTPAPTSTRTSTPAPTPTRTARGTPDSGSSPTRTPLTPATPTAMPTLHPTQTPAVGIGGVDPGFGPSVTSTYLRPVDAVVRQPDHKIIVGGSFASFAGCTRRNIARLNADGSCDSSFDPGLGLTVVYQNQLGAQITAGTHRVDLPVKALALQADGKILVGLLGNAGFQNGGLTRSAIIVRLNTDGTIDSSFNAAGLPIGLGTAQSVNAIAVQGDGKILIGGGFRYSNGKMRSGAPYPDGAIARLHADGSLDASFVVPDGQNVGGANDFGGPNGAVLAIAVQPADGKVIIGGGFRNVGVPDRYGIARLNTDGSLDPDYNVLNPTTRAFASGFGEFSNPYALALQPDGKVIVAGVLNAPNGNPSDGVAVARLNVDGSRDTTFADLHNRFVRTLALQPDHRIMIGGDFQIAAPAVRNSIARLNPDGGLDSTFDTPGMKGGLYAINGANNDVSAIALQADGSVVVVGSYDNFDGEPAEGILQLGANGSREPLFDSNGAGVSGQVYALVRQPNGKLLVGFNPGVISRPAHLNSARRGGIGRLNADGTTDTAFTSPFDYDSIVFGIALQTDGKVIVGGSLRLIGSRSAVEFARLDVNGTLDAGFVLSGPDVHLGNNTGFALQADGKILANEVNSFGQRSLVRLDTDGSRDGTFAVPLSGGIVEHIVVQPDGKILLTGLVPGSDGLFARVGRLNADGTPDPTFDPGSGPDDTVSSIILQPDGKILIGGRFVNYNGTPRQQTARINADGSLDTAFIPATPYTGFQQQVGALALRPDGKVFVAMDLTGNGVLDLRNRVFRLNADGSLDASFPQDGTGFETINAIGNGTKIRALLLQPDDGLIVGGDFDSVDGVARLALARLLGATPSCPGDCDGSGDVTVNEIIAVVNIALGNAQPSVCPNGIPAGTEIDISLIIQAVNNALTGCPG
jgi:uncharacterized delta-60 repeat protein